MNVRVVSSDSKKLVLEIEGEDHTLGNMLMKEALRHPGVNYASYRVSHPLRQMVEFVLVVKEGENPGRVMLDVINSLRRQLEEFKNVVESTLG